MSEGGAHAPDPRLRPAYGEYATPEEQAARIQQPAAWQVAPVAPVVTEAPEPGIPSPQPARSPVARPADRIITFALLAYGLVNVISSVIAFLDYEAYADTMLTMLGLDAELSDPEAARGWGIAAAVVLAIGWLATAAVSLWSARRGRLTWWIPLVGGVVFTVAAGILLAVPLLNDPTVWDALQASAGVGG